MIAGVRNLTVRNRGGLLAEFTVAAGVARGLLEYAVSKGAKEARLLDQAGIDSRTLEDPDARIASGPYKALMRASQALTGDRALALHWADEVNLARMSVVGLLGQASTTLMDSFNQVRRYGRLVTDMGLDRFGVEFVDGEMWSVDYRPEPNDFPELTETTFGFMVCGSRVAAPSTWLKEVHVTHPPPSYAAEYERVYGAPVTFNARWNALRIDRSFLAIPVNLQPRYVFGVLSKHADVLLSDLDALRTVRAEVERALMPILHTGEASADVIAAGMGLSRQTLYRRLKTEGVTFEEVLDGLRRRLAKAYLENDRVSVNEIALLVGYSEPAAFSRAFKRWTGFSPREARRKASAPPDAQQGGGRKPIPMRR